MSTLPTLPAGTSDRLKSFWARPEGKTGMIVIAAALALGLWGWGAIVGYLVSMMADTVHLAILAAELFAIGWIAFSERSHMLFRLLMRAATGLVINIDPIGILKDHLQQMRKRRAIMGDQISAVSGQIRFLKDIISKNETEAQKSMRLAEAAKTMGVKAQDPNEALRMSLQMKQQASHAGRLQQSNVGYQTLLIKLTSVYDMLVKWAAHIDFFIDDTQDQVTQSEVQYNAIKKASRAYRTALAVITGSPAENEIYNETMEHLAQYAGEQLGAMEDFQRVAQNFMDNIDVQSGAAEADALKQLDAYEQKLLTPGNESTSFLLPGVQKEPVKIGGAGRATGTDDYKDLLK